jgi:hypothetical protein
MKHRTVYNVTYLNGNDKVIDTTQIDERSESVAWDLFKEFGHKRTPKTRIEFEDAIESVKEFIMDDDNFLCGLEIPDLNLSAYLVYIGGEKVDYTVCLGDEILFEGIDFKPSTMFAQDSIESLVSLLGFITLKPGDTDKEYFEKYNEFQMGWCKSPECESLAMMVSDFESGEDEYKKAAREYFVKYFKN